MWPNETSGSKVQNKQNGAVLAYCSRSVEVFHRAYWSHHSFLTLAVTPATSEQHPNTLPSSLTLSQRLNILRAGSLWPAFPQQHLLAFCLCPFICCSLQETILQIEIWLKSRENVQWIPTHPSLQLTVVLLLSCYTNQPVSLSLPPYEACNCFILIRHYFKAAICKHSQVLPGRMLSQMFNLWSSWLL